MKLDARGSIHFLLFHASNVMALLVSQKFLGAADGTLPYRGVVFKKPLRMGNMIGETTAPPQLCPHCANSIAADAKKCPYCAAELAAEFDPPSWLNRNESLSDPGRGSDRKKKFAIPSKFIWPAAMLVAVVAAFVGGFYLQRREISVLLQANQQQLKAKDVVIEGQQAQLAKVQQQLTEGANQLSAMQAKLAENEKALSAAQQRLSVASRDAANANAARAAAATRRVTSRAPAASSTHSTAQPVSARRTSEPGVYETTQATTVYDNPSSAGRVISQIGPRTRINVVSSSGDWLEVRSNRGNPPGYVRADAARQIVRAN